MSSPVFPSLSPAGIGQAKPSYAVLVNYFQFLGCLPPITKDADIRTRILSKIEQNPDVTLQQVAVECQRLVNLKHDSTMVQQSTASAVQKKTTPSHPTDINIYQTPIRLLELWQLAFCTVLYIQDTPLPQLQSTGP